MKIAISVPSGFHARELLIPLKEIIERDDQIQQVICLTSAAEHVQEIFPTFKNEKFQFIIPPEDQASYDQLLQKLSPSVVVTNTNGLDYRDIPALKAAKQNKIPTLTFIASWDNVWKMERLKKQSKPYQNANHFIVWNKMMKDHMLRIFPELDQSIISIIGAPRFDFFHHSERIPSKQELYDYLDIPNDGRKLIHFATTELYPMEYIIKDVVSAKNKKVINEGLHLYASVHPGGNMQKHQQYAQKYNVTVRYSFGRKENYPDPSFQYNPSLQDIYMLVALFKHSDLLINQSSTVTIESFAANTPVINVKYGKPLDWWRWHHSMVYQDFKEHYLDITKHQSTKLVSNRKDLATAINGYLSNPHQDQINRANCLKEMITNTSGTASQEVLNIIKQQAIQN